jgi:hypothetical protein
MTVADTMIARERLRRDVAALTAEGRASVSSRPAGRPRHDHVRAQPDVGVLFSDGLGIGMLISAIVMLIGFVDEEDHRHRDLNARA